MKKPLLFGLALLILGAALAIAADVNVTGDWEMTITTPNGARTSTLTFTQTGENLAVKTTGRNGQEITGTGTVKGNDIEWTITRTTPQGEFSMTYKGKVDGDKMSGTFEMRGNSIEWTAVRKAK
jgi:hypothetical protein